MSNRYTKENDNRMIFHVDGSWCEAGNMHPRGVGCDADFYDDVDVEEDYLSLIRFFCTGELPAPGEEDE